MWLQTHDLAHSAGNEVRAVAKATKVEVRVRTTVKVTVKVKRK